MNLVYGQDDAIGQWVSMGVFGEPDAFSNFVTLGIESEGKLIAGIVYNNMMVSHYAPYCIEMTIFSVDSRWATRHTLKALFSYPFAQLRLKRVQALCSAKDEGVQMFLKRLGFSYEGTHRCARHDGGDAMSFAMLDTECKWLGV